MSTSRLEMDIAKAALKRSSGNSTQKSASQKTYSKLTSRAKRVPRGKNKLVIGIDFGTTFSSVSFLFRNATKTETAQSIQELLSSIDTLSGDWPGSVDDTPTVPTEILYADIVDANDDRKWFGHQVAEALENGEVPNTARCVRLAKLLLHESRETESECAKLKSLARAAGKDPYDFVRDFLTFINRRIKIYLEGRHSGWMKNTDFEYVIGCPPAWSMQAHRKLAELATQAGMPPKFRGSEAEALLATYLAKSNDPSLKVGDAVIIVDGGGGTIDLVTVVIKKLDPLEVKQACVSEGATCGGIYVDRRMKELFKIKLAHQDLNHPEKALEELMKKFVSSSKKRFNGENQSIFEVPGMRDERITITSHEMREIVFDPSVDELVRKVMKQITTSKAIKESIKIKTVAVGGGFGGNIYVCNRIEEALVNFGDGKTNIRVQKLTNPAGSNVSEGLVLLAARENLITQRHSRLNYGLLTYIEYDENEHGRSETVCPEIREQFGDECHIKLVDWFLVKGQPVKERFCIQRKAREFGALPETTGVGDELIIYEGDDLPENLIDKKYTLYKDLPKGAHIEKIEANITNIDKDEHFEKHFKEAPGAEPEPFYTISYDFEARHEDYVLDEMICSFSLWSKNGDRLPVPTTKIAINLETTMSEEGEEHLLGSLATRLEGGPHVPESDFVRGPMFPERKRGSSSFGKGGEPGVKGAPSDRGMTPRGKKRAKRGRCDVSMAA